MIVFSLPPSLICTLKASPCFADDGAGLAVEAWVESTVRYGGVRLEVDLLVGVELLDGALGGLVPLAGVFLSLFRVPFLGPFELGIRAVWLSARPNKTSVPVFSKPGSFGRDCSRSKRTGRRNRLDAADVLDRDRLDALDLGERLLDSLSPAGVVRDDDRREQRNETKRDVVAFEAVDLCAFGERAFEALWSASRSTSGLWGMTLILAATFPMIMALNPQSGHS